MTHEQASFLLHEIYLPQIKHEQATTRRVIEAIPADKSGYKPDEKSMNAMQLASHIAGSECFFLQGIGNGKLDYATHGTVPDSVKTPEQLLAWYDENWTKAFDKAAACTPADLLKDLALGPFVQPAVSMAGVCLRHSAHHRGQLSAYLRPMGSKVPSIYGPSGDEPAPAAQSQARA
ncbi:MAG: DinB family protein [Bryobacteraceae bacterium]